MGSERDIEPKREGASESNQNNNVSDRELKQSQDQSKYILPQSKLTTPEKSNNKKEAEPKRAESKRDINFDLEEKESNEELKQSEKKWKRSNDDDAGNLMSELWLEEY